MSPGLTARITKLWPSTATDIIKGLTKMEFLTSARV
jgi:hypothetical protein